MRAAPSVICSNSVIMRKYVLIGKFGRLIFHPFYPPNGRNGPFPGYIKPAIDWNHYSRMAKQVYFIAGASRGIGLSLATYLSKKPENVVFATARNPSSSSGLQELSKVADNLHVVTLDLNDEKTFETAKAEVLKITDSIDVFICNAGISTAHTQILDTPKEQFLSHYVTNALGPILLIQAFYDLVKRGTQKKVIFVSSMVGTISEYPTYSTSAYGQSKAALNHSIRQLGRELAEENFIVVPVHPGLVGTELLFGAKDQYLANNPEFAPIFAPGGHITPDESAEKLAILIENLKKEDSNKFWSYDGTEVPW